MKPVFWCNRATQSALADAIEKVIDDRSLAQRLGHAGYQRAQELFSIEKNVRELCALLL